MINNIFIRLNISNKIGMGHIKRCSRLVEELKKKNINCFIISDKNNPKLEINHKIHYLYDGKNEFKNEIEDAKKFIKAIEPLDYGYVLIDDYRLGYKWQKYVSKFTQKIILIDDFLTKNYADIIINYSPRQKYDYQNKISKRNVKLLTGIEYASFDKFKTKNLIQSDKFNITFYFGGGFDYNKISNLISNLSKNKTVYSTKSVQFNFIIGPLAKNFRNIKNKILLKKNMKIYFNPDNLESILLSSNLLISSAGTMMFNSSYLKIPTIIVNIGEFQKNVEYNISLLNHYLLLSIKDINNIKFLDLIFAIKENYNKFQNIKKLFPKNLSNNSERKIINKIFMYNSKEKNNEPIKHNHKFKKNEYVIEKCDLSYVNHYLECRNMSFNRKFSSNTSKVVKINHYIWWFKNNRKSFLLKKNNEKVLYFFVEDLIQNNKKYLISGWFGCRENILPKDIFFALKAKFKKYKNESLISYVKKNNKFAVTFSNLLGWKISNDRKVLNKLTKIKKINKNAIILYKK